MPRTGHWHWRPSTHDPVETARRCVLGLLMLGALACPLTSRAAADQRQQFLAAEQALKQEDRAEKERLGRMALDAYRRYRRRTPRGTAFKARDASIRREFASDMPFLQPELDALP